MNLLKLASLTFHRFLPQPTASNVGQPMLVMATKRTYDYQSLDEVEKAERAHPSDGHSICMRFSAAIAVR